MMFLEMNGNNWEMNWNYLEEMRIFGTGGDIDGLEIPQVG